MPPRSATALAPDRRLIGGMPNCSLTCCSKMSSRASTVCPLRVWKSCVGFATVIGSSRLRTRMRNSLQAIGSGLVLKSKLRTRKGRELLNDLALSPVLSQQRGGWLEMIEEVEKRIAQVEREVEKTATGDERVCRLRTHPGIGLLTGLAFGTDQ